MVAGWSGNNRHQQPGQHGQFVRCHHRQAVVLTVVAASGLVRLTGALYLATR